MNKQPLLLLLFVIITTLVTSGSTANNGKYNPGRRNSGRYVPTEEGKYQSNPDKWKYVHVPDQRHLGQYKHIHIPYNGGFGPYDGVNIPYLHDGRPYNHEYDPTGDYSFLQSVSNGDPFKNNLYFYNTPEIYTAYGLPIPPSNAYLPIPGTNRAGKSLKSKSSSPSSSSSSDAADLSTAASNSFSQSIQLPTDAINTFNFKPSKHASIDHISFTTDNPSEVPPIIYSFDSQSSKNVAGDQSADNTPEDDRRKYHDEGGWRIIRQEGDMNKKKYDFLYETENGIYAEEHAKLGKHEKSKVEGTNGVGYYEYTGDDDKLYRVDYSAGEEGFVPRGDHIPTPPPVPKEIQALLKYLKLKGKL